MNYVEWKLKLIEVIVNDKQFDSDFRISELEPVFNDSYKDSFDNGDTPEDAWEGELEAVADNQ